MVGFIHCEASTGHNQLNLPSDVEILPSDTVALPMGSDLVAPPMGVAEVRGELKKLNKHLRQINDLKKQVNLMAAGFLFLYNCSMICLFADHQSLEVINVM